MTNDDGTQEEIIEPATGKDYLDRTKDFDYKIEKGDLCYTLFTEKGFEWGGNWTDRKDFQHFEMPTSVTEKYSERTLHRESLTMPLYRRKTLSAVRSQTMLTHFSAVMMCM